MCAIGDQFLMLPFGNYLEHIESFSSISSMASVLVNEKATGLKYCSVCVRAEEPLYGPGQGAERTFEESL